METHINGIHNGTEIAVNDVLFKGEWGTSDLVIEGGSHNIHRITASRTTPGKSQDKDANRSEISGILHIIITVEDIC